MFLLELFSVALSSPPLMCKNYFVVVLLLHLLSKSVPDQTWGMICRSKELVNGPGSSGALSAKPKGFNLLETLNTKPLKPKP